MGVTLDHSFDDLIRIGQKSIVKHNDDGSMETIEHTDEHAVRATRQGGDLQLDVREKNFILMLREHHPRYAHFWIMVCGQSPERCRIELSGM